MAHPKPVAESQHWRARAIECRDVAGRLRVDFAREQMLKTAADFERAARDAKEREIVHGIAQLGVLVRRVHEAG